MDKQRSIRFINESTLKIIAIVLMTIDHIAMFLISPGPTYDILRSIGRMAMPLFIFMAIEGVYHTRDVKKYFLRLFVIGVLIDIFLVIFKKDMVGNMMIDLALGVVVIALLRKRNWYSLLALIPASIFVLSDFNFAINGTTFINSEYGTFGLCVFLGFYAAYIAADYLCVSAANKYSIDLETYKSIKERNVKNVCCVCALFVVVALFYFIYRFNYTLPILPPSMGMESWCFFAAVFIFFYNGRRGYDGAWFKWGSYLYYPLHIIVLYLITLI